MKLSFQSPHLYVISFSHKKLPLSIVGKLYLDAALEQYKHLLEQVKVYFSASEVMHISTCNRCEFYIVSKRHIIKEEVKHFIGEFYSFLSYEDIEKVKTQFIFKKDEKAVRYLMEVASSLQSMVVGEREIIAQVRNAYEHCKSLNLTGDLLRLVIKKVIETAKEVFGKTDIAKNPVSVASLTARILRSFNIQDDASITIIGSGATIQTFMKYFHQEKYQYTFVSRKKENSQKLQSKYGGHYMSLDELRKKEHLYTDVLIVCTASPTAIVDGTLFNKIFNGHSQPIIVDLSNPTDISEEVFQKYKFQYVGINSLKKQAKENLMKRKQSVISAKAIIDNNLDEFLKIYRERCVENVISEIPQEFNEYKNKALNEVFRKKIELLNKEHQVIIHEIINYVEEKYNTVTYKKLKSILLQ